MQTAILQAEMPAQLMTQMNTLVEQGWFRNTNDLIVDALRRLVETHRPELMEEYLWQDVEWGITWPGMRTGPASQTTLAL